MTLPDERYRAVQSARALLRDLLMPAITPRVPRAIRERARRVLRHFPGEMDMEWTARLASDIWRQM